MYYKIEDNRFTGFYENKDKDGDYTEITIEDWQGVLEKNSEGEVIFYNSKTKKLETTKVGKFEDLENGIVVYKKGKEVDYNNNQLTYLRKKYTELKVAKLDAEELGMDTSDIDIEIADIKAKVVKTQARVKELEG